MSTNHTHTQSPAETSVPIVTCIHGDKFTVTSNLSSHDHLTGLYELVHDSSIGRKFINHVKDVKVTYSTKVNNIVHGHWRWAMNSSPYTLFYASASTESCVPVDGWVDMDQHTFTGLLNPHTIVYDVYKRCEPTVTLTLTPTPTPTPTLMIPYDVYRRCDIKLPDPTPFPVPYDDVAPYDPPAGIIRHSQTERVWVKGRPTITYVDRKTIKTHTNPHKVTLHGYSMNHTDQVYLSGSNNMLSGMQIVDMFSHIKSLSGDYPGFRGTPVDYIVTSDNTIDVYIPSLTTSGKLDIIIVNRAGYESMHPGYTFTQWSDYNLQNHLITVN